MKTNTSIVHYGLTAFTTLLHVNYTIFYRWKYLESRHGPFHGCLCLPYGIIHIKDVQNSCDSLVMFFFVRGGCTDGRWYISFLRSLSNYIITLDVQVLQCVPTPSSAGCFRARIPRMLSKSPQDFKARSIPNILKWDQLDNWTRIHKRDEIVGNWPMIGKGSHLWEAFGFSMHANACYAFSTEIYSRWCLGWIYEQTSWL